MTAGWEPRPGTVAFRVLAHLATLPVGAERMTSHLADALGLDVNGVTPCLESALKARRVFARKRDSHVRSPLWWSLTDYSKDQSGVAQLAARRAHNPEVGGSSPPPASIPEEPGPQQVLKAEGASPDATDRGAPDMRSPRVGATGAGQPADAGPAGGLRIALWSDGTLQINRAPAADGAVRVLQFNEAETRQLVAYLDRVLLDGMEGRTK
jgi:hypothetical protein